MLTRGSVALREVLYCNLGDAGLLGHGLLRPVQQRANGADLAGEITPAGYAEGSPLTLLTPRSPARSGLRHDSGPRLEGYGLRRIGALIYRRAGRRRRHRPHRGS